MAGELTYTFLAVRSDGRIPVVELRAYPTDREALLQAALWLADHRSCQTVEVWRDGVFIGRRGIVSDATGIPADDG